MVNEYWVRMINNGTKERELITKEDKKYIEQCCKAQKKFCEDNKLPYFAPGNGFCYRCNAPIYKTSVSRGNTLETAKTELITGCPKCSISYCD